MSFFQALLLRCCDGGHPPLPLLALRPCPEPSFKGVGLRVVLRTGFFAMVMLSLLVSVKAGVHCERLWYIR